MVELGEKDCKDQLNETIVSNLKELSKKIENKDKIIIAKNKYIQPPIIFINNIRSYFHLFKDLKASNADALAFS